MATTSRGYNLVPDDVEPDVPYWVNPTFEQINADVGTVAAAANGAAAAVPSAKAEAIAAAAIHADAGDAALSARVSTVEATAPTLAAADQTYGHLVLDQAGKLVQGEMWDGTVHIPHLLTDRHMVGDSVTYAGSVDGYRYVLTTVDNKLLLGEKEDGTIHIPHLVADRINGVDQPPVVTPDYRILIVAGQSNSLFRFNTDGPQMEEADPRVKWWNRLTGTMTDLSPNVTPSIASEFARAYVREHPGVTVLIVPVTVGSTGFRTSSVVPPPDGYLASTGTWDRTLVADPNNLALRLISSLTGALTATGNAPVIGMLWSQGESDRTRMNESQYSAAAVDLFGVLRSTAGYDFSIIVCSFTPEEINAPQYSGTEGIIRALEGLQDELYNTAYHYGPANMATYGEQIHWSPEGNRVRGRAMALETLRRARLNVSGSSPASPINPRASRSGDQVKLTWDYPYCRVTSFKLETSPDGVTWTEQPLARPYATEHTLTASAPIRARVSTINEVGTSYATLEVAA